ncbi:MAG: TldD/PmbA family protein [Clostridiales bacterium]|nr:TldD/PmbA family protein [Clostridiales bacterium]
MNINSFIDKLFERASASDFTDFEVFYSSGDSFHVKVFEGKVDDYSVNTSYGISFRGIYNGKMGYSYTEAFDDDAYDMLIDNAMQNAKVIENEDKQFIFAGSKSYQELDMYNKELDEVSIREKINAALKLEKLTKSGHPAIDSVANTVIQSGSGDVRIKNSKGLDLSFKNNLLFCYVVAIAKQGDKMIDGSGYQIVKDFSKLDIQKIANDAVEDAVSMMDAKSVEAGEYKILFENECAGDLLATFSGIFSAENTQKDLSLLKGKENTKIAAEILTIIDDPLLEDGNASMPFDGEGVATYTKNIVESGILKTLLHNLKTAEVDGVKTTGNAAKGSYKSSIDVSGSNFYIKAGDKTFDELCEVIKEGLIITELMGLHSGANAVSGDFSLLAKGFRIINGKKADAVEQITIAGNFFTLLNEIEHIGSDLKFGLPGAACIGSPSIVVKSLSVAS